jgi:REP element-mobilizing transposase RayT
MVFPRDDDRGGFLAHLATLSRALDWSVLSYCVLGTHFHFLVRTAEPNLGHGMRDLMGRAATSLHVRYGTRGRVWEDRFKSKLVTHQAYLEHLFRYIALNPVHAGFCSEPAGWRRSAHRILAAGGDDGLVDQDAVGGLLGSTAYPYLFDELGRYGPWSNAQSPELPRPPLEQLLDAAGVLDEAMAVARLRYRYTLAQIAAATGLSVPTVARRTSKHEKEGTVPSFSW